MLRRYTVLWDWNLGVRKSKIFATENTSGRPTETTVGET